MAKPKLALIPSSQGSKLYSVLPSSGVGDFSFSRSGGATRINKDGLIETVTYGVSRLNYPMIDGKVVGCPSHLLEPSRTNLIQYSEAFDNAYWAKTNSSVVSGFISPDGTTNAFKLVEDSANSSHGILKSNFPQNIQRTFSLFAKKGENDRVFISDYNKFNRTIGVIFNLSNGTVEYNQDNTIYINPKIETFSNGWYRCSVTWTNTTGLSVPYFGNAINGANVYQGDGTSGIYIFGAQLEQGSYPTSYIPTTTTSAVTRSAETANNSGDASTFNDSEGVLMAEIAYPNSTTSSNLRLAISDGTDANRILIQNVSSTSNRLQFYLISNYTTSTDFYTNLSDITSFNKIVFKYKTNDFSVWINGFEVLTDTSGSTFSDGTLNELAFDGGSGGNDFYGSTKQIQYFDSALNDSDLEKLTSWVSFTDMANGQLYTIE